jgi:hypothetical protein
MGEPRNINLDRQAELFKRLGLFLDALSEQEIATEVTSIENTNGVSLFIRVVLMNDEN